MINTFKVPIRNLFCLLSYAHHMPELISEMRDVDEEMITMDFLAERFNLKAEQLIRRGPVRDYVENIVETNRLSGRMVMNDSLPFIMENKPVVVCEKDAYSSDILLNQIVKITLEKLYKNALINERIRRQSYLIWGKLPDVSSIAITRETFFYISYSRLTHHYKPVIHLARLLYELKLLSHHQGDWNLFTADLDEAAVNGLFEIFLKNFFQEEQNHYTVQSEKLSWCLDGNRTYLPEMRTDVSMTHRSKQEKIIIDAKFYKNMFQSYWEKDTFHSHNLYQMLAYLMHQPEDVQLKGILVYPYNGKHIHESYMWDERIQFEVRSIDLGDSWQNIRGDLLSIVESGTK